jgi:ATP-dependent DNA ligase
VSAAARALACVAVLALALAACGEDSGHDLPDGAVAAVGDETIGGAQLEEQVAALRRARSRGGEGPDRAQLRKQALAVLLRREWLEREAEERGVEVSAADVRRRWLSLARSQFKTRKALRRFLGGQTERDVMAQLRLQALAEAIERDVRREAGGESKAAERLKEQLERRWREATRCREGYDVPGCGDS